MRGRHVFSELSSVWIQGGTFSSYPGPTQQTLKKMKQTRNSVSRALGRNKGGIVT